MMRAKVVFAITAALILAVGGVLSWWRTHQRLGTPGVRLELPEQVLDYQSQKGEITQGELVTLPKDTSFARRFYYHVRNGETNGFIQLNIVLMGADRTSIHKPQYCLTTQGWQIQDQAELVIPMEKPKAYDLPVMRMIAGGIQRIPQADGSFLNIPVKGVYIYWFVDENKLTASHRERMWYMAKDLVTTGVLQRWAYVSCFAACQPGKEEAAYRELSRFLAAAVPEFQIPVQ